MGVRNNLRACAEHYPVTLITIAMKIFYGVRIICQCTQNLTSTNSSSHACGTVTSITEFMAYMLGFCIILARLGVKT